MAIKHKVAKALLEQVETDIADGKIVNVSLEEHNSMVDSCLEKAMKEVDRLNALKEDKAE